MQFQLERAKEHLDESRRAEERGDHSSSRGHLLQAARYMLEAAQRTDNPQVQAQRFAYARQFQERADALLPRIEAGRRVAERPAPSPGRPADAEAADAGGAAPWLLAERPDVHFGDVAGLEDVKQQIRLKLIYPFSHPEEARRFGVRSGGGILLYGPPGTGKTLIARAVAGELDAAFFSIKPSEIMSKWVGEAEQNVAALFDSARSYPRSVIYIDEVESLLPRRGGNSTVMARVVPQFLAELDGIGGRSPGLLLVGATNLPWLIDPAALRPGRFDEKICVPLPDADARLRILQLNLQDRPLAPAVDLAALAGQLAGYSGADIVEVCRAACEIPFLDAVLRGLQRDVTPADFEQAVDEVKPSVGEKDVLRFVEFAGQGSTARKP